MTILDNPLVAMLSLLTSVVFTAIAALVPPNGGNLVAGVFLASFAAFLGGEEDGDEYERELEDADI